MKNHLTPTPSVRPAGKLRPGDAILTNPQDGFWGLAVVLDLHVSPYSNRESVHIAITPVVRRHAFTIDDVEDDELQTLQFQQHYSPTRDVTLTKTVTCICKYPNVDAPEVEIIGFVEPGRIYAGPLSEQISISTPGAFPSEARIGSHLGNEAVVTWRRIHDADAWNAIVAKSTAEYFAREEKRLSEAREKSRLRREKKRRAPPPS